MRAESALIRMSGVLYDGGLGVVAASGPTLAKCDLELWNNHSSHVSVPLFCSEVEIMIQPRRTHDSVLNVCLEKSALNVDNIL
jgi:hypothetical protein